MNKGALNKINLSEYTPIPIYLLKCTIDKIRSDDFSFNNELFKSAPFKAISIPRHTAQVRLANCFLAHIYAAAAFDSFAQAR